LIQQPCFLTFFTVLKAAPDLELPERSISGSFYTYDNTGFTERQTIVEHFTLFTDIVGEWEFFKQPSREPASVHSRTEAQVLIFVVFALHALPCAVNY
jgi:hypothetical protein